MAPIWPFFFGRDDFGEKVFFFVQHNTNYEREREREREGKKKERLCADAAREAQTLYIANRFGFLRRALFVCNLVPLLL